VHEFPFLPLPNYIFFLPCSYLLIPCFILFFLSILCLPIYLSLPPFFFLVYISLIFLSLLYLYRRKAEKGKEIKNREERKGKRE
jgi:hypothetical protein